MAGYQRSWPPTIKGFVVKHRRGGVYPCCWLLIVTWEYFNLISWFNGVVEPRSTLPNSSVFYLWYFDTLIPKQLLLEHKYSSWFSSSISWPYSLHIWDANSKFQGLTEIVWIVGIFTNNIKMENQHRTLLLLEIGDEDKETLRLW